MNTRRIQALTASIVFSSLLVVLIALGQNTDISIRDRVMLDSARIDSLISGLQELNRGGTNTAQLLAIKVNGQAVEIMNLQRQVEALTQQFYAVLVFVFLQTAAAATFGVRYWISNSRRR